MHIAEGYFEGTIGYQLNAANEVSSHFIVDRDGKVAQMVDTADKAWTQRAGNGHWISVECAGFTKANPLHASHPGWEQLSAQQIAAIGRILAKTHQVYGVPLQIATSPSGRGLGHHSMGGTAWGHLDCPGDPIISQKPAILAAAVAAINGPEVPDMDPNAHDIHPQLSNKQVFRDLWDEVVSGRPDGDAKVSRFGNRNGWNAVLTALTAIAAKVDIDPAELAAMQKAAQDGAAAALAAALGQWEAAVTAAVEAALPDGIEQAARDGVLSAIHDAAASVAGATAGTEAS